MAFWNESEPVARKAHRCDECGFQIAAGERYNRGAGIGVSGEFSHWASHLDCRDCALELRKAGDFLDDEWVTVEEHVWEMDGAGLSWLQMTYPAIYERFRAQLTEHERFPEHYKWFGATHIKPYRWESLA